MDAFRLGKIAYVFSDALFGEKLVLRTSFVALPITVFIGKVPLFSERGIFGGHRIWKLFY